MAIAYRVGNNQTSFTATSITLSANAPPSGGVNDLYLALCFGIDIGSQTWIAPTSGVGTSPFTLYHTWTFSNMTVSLFWRRSLAGDPASWVFTTSGTGSSTNRLRGGWNQYFNNTPGGLAFIEIADAVGALVATGNNLTGPTLTITHTDLGAGWNLGNDPTNTAGGYSNPEQFAPYSVSFEWGGEPGNIGSDAFNFYISNTSFLPPTITGITWHQPGGQNNNPILAGQWAITDTAPTPSAGWGVGSSHTGQWSTGLVSSMTRPKLKRRRGGLLVPAYC